MLSTPHRFVKCQPSHGAAFKRTTAQIICQMRRLKTVDEKPRRRGWFHRDCFIFQSCFGKPPSNTCGGQRWETNYKTSTVLSRANFGQSTVLYVKRYWFQNRSCINMLFSGNDNLTTIFLLKHIHVPNQQAQMAKYMNDAIFQNDKCT